MDNWAIVNQSFPEYTLLREPNKAVLVCSVKQMDNFNNSTFAATNLSLVLW